MYKRIRTGLVSTALVAGSFIGAGVVSAQVDDTTPTDTSTQQPADETPADETPADETPADGEHGPRGERGAEWAQATADLLGIDVDDLRAALQDGQTLAQLAEANGVDVQTIIDAQVAAKTEQINAAVEAGRLTDAEAAEKLAGLVEQVTTAVNEGGLGHGERGNRGNRGERGNRGGRGGNGEQAQATADLLGIDAAELQTALEGGLTLAEVAEANGADVQVVIDAQVAAATERIDASVESGRLTADEAAEKLADVEERVTSGVNEVRPERGERGERGGRGGRGGAPAADVAETDG